MGGSWSSAAVCPGTPLASLPSSNEPPLPSYDAVVIGGSFAGMSAALQLARARRCVLVIDAGHPRNNPAAVSHGFLGQDGSATPALLQTSRQQLLRYPGLHWFNGTARRAWGRIDDFSVLLDGGASVRARRLVLAHGVVDRLPAVSGLAERWGKTVLHCPYCHGYELPDRPLGVLAQHNAEAEAQTEAVLLCDWGSVVLFRNGTLPPAPDARLHGRGIRVVGDLIERITGEADVELAGGRTVSLAALFIVTQTQLSTPLAAQLGCDLQSEGCITTDSSKQTTIPGVFACGDCARMAGNISLAVGEGALAGVASHRSLSGLLQG